MLEDNFETRYQGFDPNDPQSSIIFSLMQNAHLSASLAFAEDVAGAMAGGPIRHSRGVSQDPFWVLWRTAMPSVLIEVGFMTNPDDLAVMRSEAGRQGIADNIFKAFCVFKTRYDGSASIPPVEDVKPVVTPSGEPAVPAEPQHRNGPKDGVLYGIQVLAIGKKMDPKDPFFQGYEPMELKVGNLYKYIICPDTYLSQAKKSYTKVVTIFKDSYLVKVENGVSSPVR
jgi:N-acetylmuramoyl-L-alanine amidase